MRIHTKVAEHPAGPVGWVSAMLMALVLSGAAALGQAARFAADGSLPGSPGIALDTLRTSGIYLPRLLDLQVDQAPVERWGGYSGSTPLFDGETLLKVWGPRGVPGVEQNRLTPFAPVIRQGYKPTGQTRPPVEVIRCSAELPIFNLDFGTLDIGCYVVRVITAVRTEDIDQYRRPLYVDFKVNDQADGKSTLYRQRVPYWDDFYAVAEIYFNADEKRPYTGTLTVGKGSLVDLYVHRIEFHDVLKGLAGKAAKDRPSFFTLEERARLRMTANAGEVRQKVGREVALDAYLASNAPELGPPERQKRDDLIWNAFPPMNSEYVVEYDEGFAAQASRPGKMSTEEAAQKYGTWEFPYHWKSGWLQPLELANNKLNLRYTREALVNYRPLPDPYPFKDDGLGVYFPKQEGMAHAEHFLPIPNILGLRWEAMRLPVAPYHGADITHRLPYLYHALNDRRAARDAAFVLAKWAYLYPTFTQAQTLGFALISPGSMYERDMRLTIRYNPRLDELLMGLVTSYDMLYDYIKGNQPLAQAVGRYIPWVRTDEDVRRLIETRILQFGAKQCMRFHIVSDKGHPAMFLRVAAAQQDPDVTRPWMESLWTHTWIYPHPRAGLPDYLSTTTQRDGTTTIGSVFYTWGGSDFGEVVDLARRYVVNGGDKKYDLSDPRLYGKIQWACAFPLDSSIAGGYPMTIGDVGGPAKPRLFEQLAPFEDIFRDGFRRTTDGRLAWILKNYYARTTESDEEWRQVEATAAAEGRNPFLSQRSRVMANWAGILESGQESDDYRFKRTAFLRVGYGYGHAHQDTLDLQVQAHGCRMVNDVGWRGEYADPSAGSTIFHNRVEVNGKDHPRQGGWQGHGWISTFKPLAGAQYIEAQAVPPGNHANVRHYSRSVALIDVEEGVPGTAPPSTAIYQGSATKHDPKAVTPNSYVFDVQRIAGGTWHTFCFHGNYSDDFEVNIRDKKAVGQATLKPPADTSPEANYLRKFLDGEGLKYAGDAEETVVATWRLRRATDPITANKPYSGKTVSLAQQNAEGAMLGADYDANAPRKFTRLHLFGRKGERILVGWLSPNEERVSETWPFLMVQKQTEDVKTELVYPAIIEPYVGEPFIASAKLVDIPGNETDALRAVAVEVKTKPRPSEQAGRTDLCFSDGRAAKRTIGDVTAACRFAYVSRDANGLRLAHLVDGTELETPEFAAKLDSPAYEGRITKVDYGQRRIWLDTKLPVRLRPGEQGEIGNEKHRTSFTVTAAAHEGEATVLTLDKPADLSYAHIQRVNPLRNQVVTTLGPEAMPRGMTEGLTCTNEKMTRFWRCKVLGQQPDGYGSELEGGLKEDDLPEGSVLRLWEYGPGDGVRIPCHFHIARTGQAGAFIVRANAAVHLVPKARGMRIVDGGPGFFSPTPPAPGK